MLRPQLLDIKFEKEWVGVFIAGDACIAPTNNRDFIVPIYHNLRVEACFDRSNKK